jgi:large subunit ribosomal protein MRP49
MTAISEPGTTSGEKAMDLSPTADSHWWRFVETRKLWKNYLPRLKYWNPGVPIIVNRHTDNAGTPTLSVYFREPQDPESEESKALSSSPSKKSSIAVQAEEKLRSSTKGETPAPPPEEGETVVTIDMRLQHSDALLSQLLQATNATIIDPTPEDLAAMREVEQLKEKGEIDRAIVKAFVDEKKRENAMMMRAKKEAEAIKAANA